MGTSDHIGEKTHPFFFFLKKLKNDYNMKYAVPFMICMSI